MEKIGKRRRKNKGERINSVLLNRVVIQITHQKCEEMRIMSNNMRNKMVLQGFCRQWVCTWCHWIHIIILQSPITCDRVTKYDSKKREGFSRNIQTCLKWHFSDNAQSLLFCLAQEFLLTRSALSPCKSQAWSWTSLSFSKWCEITDNEDRILISPGSVGYAQLLLSIQGNSHFPLS